MKKIFVLFILLGCYQSEKDQINSNLDYFPINVYDFSVNNQFLSSIRTDYRVDEFDSLFFFDIKIYELDKEIERKLVLCESNEELDEIEKSIVISECKSRLLNEIIHKLGNPLREIEFNEPRASYFVDFTNTHGIVEGTTEWYSDSLGPKLKISYLGNSFIVDVYDQVKLR